MADFTIKTYRILLHALKDQGFSFLPFCVSTKGLPEKSIVLRHDVDALPENSLHFARLQAELGIRGSYYFRIVTESFDEKIIKEIVSLGHEVGYHYEDVTIVAQRHNGTTAQRLKPQTANRKPQTQNEDEECLASLAIESFKENLGKIRQVVPVKTICMHGSPMSKWDSRLLWKYYDYHDFGITGEPYFDIDFNEVLYLTDTGRRWDGEKVSIRDKAEGGRRKAEGKKTEEKMGRIGEEENGRNTAEFIPKPQTANRSEAKIPRQRDHKPFPAFHSTFDIIRAAEEGSLPDKIMMTFHPQRWTDKPIPWVKELVWQNIKNVGKYVLIKARS